MVTVIGTGIAGLVLLFLEMFLPGLIAGIIGGVLLIISVVLAYDISPEAGNITLLVSALSSGALWWWWATQFQRTRLGRMMTLDATIPGSSEIAGLAVLVGKTGATATALRPSGTVVIEGKRVDATTDGAFLEIGTDIIVIRTSGMGVVVREAAGKE